MTVGLFLSNPTPQGTRYTCLNNVKDVGVLTCCSSHASGLSHLDLRDSDPPAQAFGKRLINISYTLLPPVFIRPFIADHGKYNEF